MTPEEIVDRIARMTDPSKVAEAGDSATVLASLIHECRVVQSPRHRRRRVRVFAHQTTDFTRAMLRIENAPAEDLRGFVREVIDLLWGEGAASSKREPRRLDFDKQWEVETIEEVAAAVSRRSFYPFPDAEGEPAPDRTP